MPSDSPPEASKIQKGQLMRTQRILAALIAALGLAAISHAPTHAQTYGLGQNTLTVSSYVPPGGTIEVTLPTGTIVIVQCQAGCYPGEQIDLVTVAPPGGYQTLSYGYQSPYGLGVPASPFAGTYLNNPFTGPFARGFGFPFGGGRAFPRIGRGDRDCPNGSEPAATRPHCP